jgi:hypothetical protein
MTDQQDWIDAAITYYGQGRNLDAMLRAREQYDALRAEVERLRVALGSLVSYTEACEGLLNASPSGQVQQARALLSPRTVQEE